MIKVTTPEMAVDEKRLQTAVNNAVDKASKFLQKSKPTIYKDSVRRQQYLDAVIKSTVQQNGFEKKHGYLPYSYYRVFGITFE